MFCLKVVKFSYCGVQISCANYFSTIENPIYAFPQVVFSLEYNLISGYNKVQIATPIKVEKGSVVNINNYYDYTNYYSYNYYNGLIGIDTSGTASYSDYVYQTMTTSKKLNRLNNIKNYRLYLNAIIDTKYFIAKLNIFHQYESFGFYNITGSFSQIGRTQSVQIINGNILNKFYYNLTFELFLNFRYEILVSKGKIKLN